MTAEEIKKFIDDSTAVEQMSQEELQQTNGNE
jgi:hypothetical protein